MVFPTHPVVSIEESYDRHQARGLKKNLNNRLNLVLLHTIEETAISIPPTLDFSKMPEPSEQTARPADSYSKKTPPCLSDKALTNGQGDVLFIFTQLPTDFLFPLHAAHSFLRNDVPYPQPLLRCRTPCAASRSHWETRAVCTDIRLLKISDFRS